jgi:hypothetical protein
LKRFTPIFLFKPLNLVYQLKTSFFINYLMRTKHLLLFIFVIVLTTSACLKGYNPVPQKPLAVDVYTAGYTTASNSSLVATYWKNGVATKVGDSSMNSVAYSITVSGGNVYMAGYTKIQTGNQIACYWKNGILTKLGDGSTPTRAYSIVVSAGDVYVAGTSGNIGSTAVYWKNGVVTLLGDNSSFSGADAIAVKGNNVYVVGYSNNNYATFWQNGKDTILNANDIGNAADIALYGSDIFITGFVGSSGGAIFWKNGMPVSLPEDGAPLVANAIAVNGTGLYVSGNNDGQYGVYWRNGVLNKLASGTLVDDIAANGYDIYLAGAQTDASAGTSNAVYWKNGTVVNLAKNAEAHSIVVVPK